MTIRCGKIRRHGISFPRLFSCGGPMLSTYTSRRPKKTKGFNLYPERHFEHGWIGVHAGAGEGQLSAIVPPIRHMLAIKMA